MRKRLEIKKGLGQQLEKVLFQLFPFCEIIIFLQTAVLLLYFVSLQNYVIVSGIILYYFLL